MAKTYHIIKGNNCTVLFIKIPSNTSEYFLTKQAFLRKGDGMYLMAVDKDSKYPMAIPIPIGNYIFKYSLEYLVQEVGDFNDITEITGLGLRTILHQLEYHGFKVKNPIVKPNHKHTKYYTGIGDYSSDYLDWSKAQHKLDRMLIYINYPNTTLHQTFIQP